MKANAIPLFIRVLEMLGAITDDVVPSNSIAITTANIPLANPTILNIVFTHFF